MRISSQIDVDLVGVRISAPLVRRHRLSRVWCLAFAVIPSRHGGASVEDLDSDFLVVGFVRDGVAFTAAGTGAEGRLVEVGAVLVVARELVGVARFRHGALSRVGSLVPIRIVTFIRAKAFGNVTGRSTEDLLVVDEFCGPELLYSKTQFRGPSMIGNEMCATVENESAYDIALEYNLHQFSAQNNR